MKKVFLAMFFLLFLQAVTAQQVNVETVFNFPLESGLQDVFDGVTVNPDSNAFTAFVLSAEQNNIELEIIYYPFGAFIECVQDVCTSEDFSKYWQFSVNNAPSSVGVSDYIVQEGDVLSLDYFDGRTLDALEWLADKQEENGKIGSNSFQHAFALMGLSLAQESGIEMEEQQENGIDYLISLQEDDASFGDDLQTAVSVMALLSSRLDLNEFEVNGTNSLQTLASHQQQDGGFASGTSSSDVDTTSWAAVAFAQAGQNMPDGNGNTPADYLFLAQHENGSWGYNEDDPAESIEFTEEALIALSAAAEQRNEQIDNGLDWLLGQQDAEGCIGDGFRTALGFAAFLAWDENDSAENARTCLEGQQNGDGSFGRTTNQSNAMDTGLAVIALSGKTFPLTASDGNGSPSDGTVGYNSIVKFVAEIKNTSEVDAQNIGVFLEGIPADWIIQNGSDLHFDEIEEGETVLAEIFVKIQQAGEFFVHAVVSTDTATVDFLSNEVEFEAKEAALEVTLSLEE